MLAVVAPPTTVTGRRPPIDVETAIAIAPEIWPDSRLKASYAATAVILNDTAGVLIEQAAALRWDDVNVVTGAITGGHRVPAGPLPQLNNHRRIVRRAGLRSTCSRRSPADVALRR